MCLFRYRFDPNPAIQQAMSSIWTAVVPESRKEVVLINTLSWLFVVMCLLLKVETHFNAILDDLLKNLASSLWRIRQSWFVFRKWRYWNLCHTIPLFLVFSPQSCLALSDLLQGRQVDRCIDQLPKMWDLVLRARDDIKVDTICVC